jgi:hypothetical protein
LETLFCYVQSLICEHADLCLVFHQKNIANSATVIGHPFKNCSDPPILLLRPIKTVPISDRIRKCVAQ